MNLGASVQMALRSLRMNKMRALLTMLGIIIGIGSVIAILTVGNALTGSINTSLSTFGANNITVSLQQRGQTNRFQSGSGLSGQTSTQQPADKDLVTDDMIDALRQRYPTSIVGVSLTKSVGTGKARDERDYAEVEQAIIKEGRAKLYRNGSSYRTSVDGGGKLMPFEDWCIEHTGYPSQRCGMSKTEFIAYFEPEFRAEYEELAEEWKAEQE